jgi:hypothetical protein
VANSHENPGKSQGILKWCFPGNVFEDDKIRKNVFNNLYYNLFWHSFKIFYQIK